MKRWLVLLIVLSLPCLAAIKGNGTSGMMISGDGSSGCAHCWPAPTSYTIVSWFKGVADPNSSATKTVMLFTEEASPGSDIEFNWSHTNASYKDACTHASSFPIANIAPVVGGTWYSIACTWDGTTLRSYRNGSLISSTAISSIASGGGLVAALGYFPGHSAFNDGTVAEIAYFSNVVLTANELKALAAGTTPMTLRKPTVYLAMWGTAFAATYEADLSGTLDPAGNVVFGQFYNWSGSAWSTSTSGVSVANHAPVRPFSTEEEGQGGQ